MKRVAKAVYGVAAVFAAGCGTGAPNASPLSTSGAAGMLAAVAGGGSGGIPITTGGVMTTGGVAGTSGSGGTGGSSTSGGAGGAAGSAGMNAGAGGMGLPEVSADGDGDRTIGPTYAEDPLLKRKPDSPQGKLISFEMQSADSAIYKGVNGAYTRNVKVYVPSQYVAGTPAPFIVSQDAMAQDLLPPTLDNLIAMKKMPTVVVVFVANGGGDAQGSERGLEYDTVSGLFAEFIEKEVLPRAVSEVKTQLNLELKLTKDPNGRGTFGGSSGGAASFSMAFWHPDLFRRVLTFSGTFLSQVTDASPFPHGCWIYHDVDPHFVELTEAPHGLIVQHCFDPALLGVGNPGPCDTPLTQMACEAVPGCSWNVAQNKPIRVWLESAEQDFGTPGHELDPKYGTKPYRDFDIANQRMAAALKARGYHYHYDHALSAGHVDGKVVSQTLPEALQWVWRGYPIE